MTTSDYYTVDEIINRVVSKYPVENIDYYEMVGYIFDAILTIGVFEKLEPKVSIIEIKDYKGMLPCDLVYIDQVRICKGNLISKDPDTFHLSKDRVNNNSKFYIIKKNFIHLNMKEGELEISYRAIPTDEKGFPLVNPEISYVEAVTYYVLEKIFEKLFLIDKVSADKFSYVIQQRDWYIGQAQVSSKIPDPETMEIIKNNMLRIIEDSRDRNKNYKTLSYKQYYRDE